MITEKINTKNAVITYTESDEKEAPRAIELANSAARMLILLNKMERDFQNRRKTEESGNVELF